MRDVTIVALAASVLTWVGFALTFAMPHQAMFSLKGLKSGAIGELRARHICKFFAVKSQDSATPNDWLAPDEMASETSAVVRQSRHHIGDSLEVRCEDDGLWYQAVIDRQHEDGKFMVRFEKNGYEYHYPLAAWRTKLNRRVNELEMSPANSKAFQHVPPNKWLDGAVERLTPFGAFVTVQLRDGKFVGRGLVHVSEISDGFVKSPEEALSIGQVVQVRVLSVTDGRICLSMKKLTSAADLDTFKHISSAEWLEGIVDKIVSMGIFVTVEPAGGGTPCRGLVRISEIKDGFVTNPEDEVSVGQVVRVRVKKVEKGQMELSMRNLKTAVDLDAFKVGAWLDGIVHGLAPSGVLVAVEPPGGGIVCTGMVSSNKLNKGLLKTASIGQAVRVRVLSVAKGQLMLSMKDLADEVGLDTSTNLTIADDLDAFKVGEWLDGVVHGHPAPYGVLVAVKPPGGGILCTGMVSSNELKKRWLKTASIGQAVRVRVLSVAKGLLMVSTKDLADEVGLDTSTNLTIADDLDAFTRLSSN